MERHTLGKKFAEFVKNNNLISFSETKQEIFYLPYTSKKKNIRVYIFANIVESTNTLKIGFRAPLIKNNDISEVRETLLDLNAKLTIGALALEKNTDMIEFSINYTVEDDEEIDRTRYDKIIVFCMNVFFDLHNRKLIDRENSMNE